MFKPGRHIVRLCIQKKKITTQHFFVETLQVETEKILTLNSLYLCHQANVCLPQFPFLSDSPSF